MSRRETDTHRNTYTHPHIDGDTYTVERSVTSNIFNYETLKVAKLKCNEHKNGAIGLHDGWGGERWGVLLLGSL